MSKFNEYIKIIDNEFNSLSDLSIPKLEKLIVNSIELNNNERSKLMLYFLDKYDEHLFNKCDEYLAEHNILGFMNISDLRNEIKLFKDKFISLSIEYNLDITNLENELKNLSDDQKEKIQQLKEDDNSQNNYDLDTILDKLVLNNYDRNKLTKSELDFLDNYNKK
ncbi:MAG: hypothetical protein M0R46_10660 [Candidatus Muirbacterium halophilum]|nr:hypothetical protein [Candidatus Muirbacterium halophilum]